jgi:hypothetical protein
MSNLPLSTTVLYLEPDGTYSATATGVTGESATTVNVTDLVCTDDLDANGSETTSDLQGLAQDIYHLLLESYGSNLDDPTKGFGAFTLLSGSSVNLLAAAGSIDSMLRSDSRVDMSKTTVTSTTSSPPSYLISIEIQANGALLPLQFSFSPLRSLQQV